MREIKFRAWTGDEMIYEGWSGNVFTNKVIIFRYDRVMQYTGLKDKNSTEIYEGDIIHDDGRYIGSVYWNQDHCQFLVHFAGLEDQELGEWAEVVGNIYEANNAVK